MILFRRLSQLVFRCFSAAVVMSLLSFMPSVHAQFNPPSGQYCGSFTQIGNDTSIAGAGTLSLSTPRTYVLQLSRGTTVTFVDTGAFTVNQVGAMAFTVESTQSSAMRPTPLGIAYYVGQYSNSNVGITMDFGDFVMDMTSGQCPSVTPTPTPAVTSTAIVAITGGAVVLVGLIAVGSILIIRKRNDMRVTAIVLPSLSGAMQQPRPISIIDHTSSDDSAEVVRPKPLYAFA